MKKITTILLLITTLLSGHKLFAQVGNDTLREKLTELKDRISGLEERMLTPESDLAKLNKIKFSGYIQAQWENYSNKLTYPDNSFFLRRVRLKTTYQPADGVAFVLQPDFAPSGFSLKDAYAQLNDPWLKQFSLTIGQFNRPSYEVEYSSSQREVPERSGIIRALYPGERALGAKIEYTPKAFPLKVQLAIFNGNDGGIAYPSFTSGLTYPGSSNPNPVNKDFDNFKDFMARATYSVKLGNFGGLDFGAHAYLGKVKAAVDTVINSKYQSEKIVKVGDALNRTWFGVEFQLFMDILGGASLKGEYITGTNAIPGYSTTSTGVTSVGSTISHDTLTVTTTNATAVTFQPNYISKFSGYYLYF
ncbi:MAG: porin, partial [Bacteroidetes bacterium]|nr:porin [Bacteroidota bacterium]